MQSDDYLEPYHLSPYDRGTVLGLAWNKGCIDCGVLWDNYMVRNDVWTEAQLRKADCCRCLMKLFRRRRKTHTYADNLEDFRG
jgi:hypothetical protein